MSFASIRNIIAVTAFSTAIAGCTDERLLPENPPESESLPITLTAEYPSATRASDAGFDHGDRMGVYVLDYTDDLPEGFGAGERASNVRFDHNGSDNTWKGVSDIYWKDKNSPADIIGYYPFEAEIENPENMPVSVARRQDTERDGNTLGGYENSDFLWAKAEKAMPASSVNLTFSHALAGVTVRLSEGEGFADGEWENLQKKTVVSNVIPDGRINLATGVVTAETSGPISIIPLEYADCFRAVVIPQTVDAGQDLIGISVGSDSYVLSKKEAFTYMPGKMHTFTVTVNKSGEGTLSFSLSDEAITPWIDDAEFRDGIVRRYTIIDVPECGQLPSVVESLNLEPSRIYNLKILGHVDVKDFEYIRENIRNLTAINLYECTTYRNGEPYILTNSALAGMNISHVVFPRNIKMIANEALRGTSLLGNLIIPEGVEHLGWGAFMDCTVTGSLTLPSTLRIIEGSVFEYTELSGELYLPENLVSIGAGAFHEARFSGELTLPENIKEVGSFAFRGNQFSGSLRIPQGLKVIEQGVFQDCPFSGTLILPEGIERIGDQAFADCGFRGELALPSSLRWIGRQAFLANKYSSIAFPENLSYLGEGAFSECSRLSGSVALPEKLTAIYAWTFNRCTLLDEIIIPKGIGKIEGLAFGECYNLSSVVCNAETPPLLMEYQWNGRTYLPFDGVPKDNFTVQVPEKSVETYRRATGWRDFKRIAAYSNFVCRPAKACALNTAHEETIVLNSDGEWEATHVPSWVRLSKTAGNGKTEILLTINQLAANQGNRSDYVEFSLKNSEFTTRCEIEQWDYRYGEDECVTLQRATKGNGIDVLFIGDCFDAEAIATGKYMDLVGRQMEAFFGVEPYTTYRDYFNVYACVSLSQESGVNTANSWYNTRFSTYFGSDNGCSTASLNCFEPDMVFDYAVDHSPLTRDNMWRSLVIMALNNDEYGSTSVMTWNGSAIAICCDSSDPYPMDTRGVLQHEACGHAFGKLAEERITENKYLSKQEIATVNEAHQRGWYQNISLTGKLSDVKWSHFIFDKRYSDKVDVFEGGFGKTRGCFRPEINSCMNYGIPYFNAMSRQAIVERILDYSGEGFSMEKFYANDKDTWGVTSGTRAIGDSQAAPSSTHNPVKIVKSKKY